MADIKDLVASLNLYAQNPTDPALTSDDARELVAELEGTLERPEDFITRAMGAARFLMRHNLLDSSFPVRQFKLWNLPPVVSNIPALPTILDPEPQTPELHVPQLKLFVHIEDGVYAAMDEVPEKVIKRHVASKSETPIFLATRHHVWWMEMMDRDIPQMGEEALVQGGMIVYGRFQTNPADRKAVEAILKGAAKTAKLEVQVITPQVQTWWRPLWEKALADPQTPPDFLAAILAEVKREDPDESAYWIEDLEDSKVEGVEIRVAHIEARVDNPAVVPPVPAEDAEFHARLEALKTMGADPHFTQINKQLETLYREALAAPTLEIQFAKIKAIKETLADMQVERLDAVVEGEKVVEPPVVKPVGALLAAPSIGSSATNIVELVDRLKQVYLQFIESPEAQEALALKDAPYDSTKYDFVDVTTNIFIGLLNCAEILNELGEAQKSEDLLNQLSQISSIYKDPSGAGKLDEAIQQVKDKKYVLRLEPEGDDSDDVLLFSRLISDEKWDLSFQEAQATVQNEKSLMHMNWVVLGLLKKYGEVSRVGAAPSIAVPILTPDQQLIQKYLEGIELPNPGTHFSRPDLLEVAALVFCHRILGNVARAEELAQKIKDKYIPLLSASERPRSQKILDLAGQGFLIADMVKTLRSDEIPQPNAIKDILQKAEAGNISDALDLVSTFGSVSKVLAHLLASTQPHKLVKVKSVRPSDFFQVEPVAIKTVETNTIPFNPSVEIFKMVQHYSFDETLSPADAVQLGRVLGLLGLKAEEKKYLDWARRKGGKGPQIMGEIQDAIDRVVDTNELMIDDDLKFMTGVSILDFEKSIKEEGRFPDLATSPLLPAHLLFLSTYLAEKNLLPSLGASNPPSTISLNTDLLQAEAGFVLSEGGAGVSVSSDVRDKLLSLQPRLMPGPVTISLQNDILVFLPMPASHMHMPLSSAFPAFNGALVQPGDQILLRPVGTSWKISNLTQMARDIAEQANDIKTNLPHLPLAQKEILQAALDIVKSFPGTILGQGENAGSFGRLALVFAALNQPQLAQDIFDLAALDLVSMSDLSNKETITKALANLAQGQIIFPYAPTPTQLATDQFKTSFPDMHEILELAAAGKWSEVSSKLKDLGDPIHVLLLLAAQSNGYTVEEAGGATYLKIKTFGAGGVSAVGAQHAAPLPHDITFPITATPQPITLKWSEQPALIQTLTRLENKDVQVNFGPAGEFSWKSSPGKVGGIVSLNQSRLGLNPDVLAKIQVGSQIIFKSLPNGQFDVFVANGRASAVIPSIKAEQQKILEAVEKITIVRTAFADANHCVKLASLAFCLNALGRPDEAAQIFKSLQQITDSNIVRLRPLFELLSEGVLPLTSGVMDRDNIDKIYAALFQSHPGRLNEMTSAVDAAQAGRWDEAIEMVNSLDPDPRWPNSDPQWATLIALIAIANGATPVTKAGNTYIKVNPVGAAALQAVPTLTPEQKLILDEFLKLEPLNLTRPDEIHKRYQYIFKIGLFAFCLKVLGGDEKKSQELFALALGEANSHREPGLIQLIQILSQGIIPIQTLDSQSDVDSLYQKVTRGSRPWPEGKKIFSLAQNKKWAEALAEIMALPSGEQKLLCFMLLAALANGVKQVKVDVVSWKQEDYLQVNRAGQVFAVGATASPLYAGRTPALTADIVFPVSATPQPITLKWSEQPALIQELTGETGKDIQVIFGISGAFTWQITPGQVNSAHLNQPRLGLKPKVLAQIKVGSQVIFKPLVNGQFDVFVASSAVSVGANNYSPLRGSTTGVSPTAIFDTRLMSGETGFVVKNNAIINFNNKEAEKLKKLFKAPRRKGGQGLLIINPLNHFLALDLGALAGQFRVDIQTKFPNIDISQIQPDDEFILRPKGPDWEMFNVSQMVRDIQAQVADLESNPSALPSPQKELMAIANDLTTTRLALMQSNLNEVEFLSLLEITMVYEALGQHDLAQKLFDLIALLAKDPQEMLYVKKAVEGKMNTLWPVTSDDLVPVAYISEDSAMTQAMNLARAGNWSDLPSHSMNVRGTLLLFTAQANGYTIEEEGAITYIKINPLGTGASTSVVPQVGAQHAAPLRASTTGVAPATIFDTGLMSLEEGIVLRKGEPFVFTSREQAEKYAPYFQGRLNAPGGASLKIKGNFIELFDSQGDVDGKKYFDPSFSTRVGDLSQAQDGDEILLRLNNGRLELFNISLMVRDAQAEVAALVGFNSLPFPQKELQTFANSFAAAHLNLTADDLKGHTFSSFLSLALIYEALGQHLLAQKFFDLGMLLRPLTALPAKETIEGKLSPKWSVSQDSLISPSLHQLDASFAEILQLAEEGKWSDVFPRVNNIDVLLFLLAQANGWTVFPEGGKTYIKINPIGAGTATSGSQVGAIHELPLQGDIPTISLYAGRTPGLGLTQLPPVLGGVTPPPPPPAPPAEPVIPEAPKRVMHLEKQVFDFEHLPKRDPSTIKDYERWKNYIPKFNGNIVLFPRFKQMLDEVARFVTLDTRVAFQFYGPPGGSKTTFAEMIAGAMGVPLLRFPFNKKTEASDTEGAWTLTSVDGKLVPIFEEGAATIAIENGFHLIWDEPDMARKGVLTALNHLIEPPEYVLMRGRDGVVRPIKVHKDFRLHVTENGAEQAYREPHGEDFSGRFIPFYVGPWTEEEYTYVLDQLHGVKEGRRMMNLKLVQAMAKLHCRMIQLAQGVKEQNFSFAGFGVKIGQDVEFTPRSLFRLAKRLQAGGLTPDNLFRSLRAEYVLPLADPTDQKLVWDTIREYFKPALAEMKWDENTLDPAKYQLPEVTLETLSQKYLGGRKIRLRKGFVWTGQALRLADEILWNWSQGIDVMILGGSNEGKTKLIAELAAILKVELNFMILSTKTNHRDLLGGLKRVGADYKFVAGPLLNSVKHGGIGHFDEYLAADPGKMEGLVNPLLDDAQSVFISGPYEEEGGFHRVHRYVDNINPMNSTHFVFTSNPAHGNFQGRYASSGAAMSRVAVIFLEDNLKMQAADRIAIAQNVHQYDANKRQAQLDRLAVAEAAEKVVAGDRRDLATLRYSSGSRLRGRNRFHFITLHPDMVKEFHMPSQLVWDSASQQMFEYVPPQKQAVVEVRPGEWEMPPTGGTFVRMKASTQTNLDALAVHLKKKIEKEAKAKTGRDLKISFTMGGGHFTDLRDKSLHLNLLDLLEQPLPAAKGVGNHEWSHGTIDGAHPFYDSFEPGRLLANVVGDPRMDEFAMTWSEAAKAEMMALNDHFRPLNPPRKEKVSFISLLPHEQFAHAVIYYWRSGKIIPWIIDKDVKQALEEALPILKKGFTELPATLSEKDIATSLDTFYKTLDKAWPIYEKLIKKSQQELEKRRAAGQSLESLMQPQGLELDPQQLEMMMKMLGLKLEGVTDPAQQIQIVLEVRSGALANQFEPQDPAKFEERIKAVAQARADKAAGLDPKAPKSAPLPPPASDAPLTAEEETEIQANTFQLLQEAVDQDLYTRYLPPGIREAARKLAKIMPPIEPVEASDPRVDGKEVNIDAVIQDLLRPDPTLEVMTDEEDSPDVDAQFIFLSDVSWSIGGDPVARENMMRVSAALIALSEELKVNYGELAFGSRTAWIKRLKGSVNTGRKKNEILNKKNQAFDDTSINGDTNIALPMAQAVQALGKTRGAAKYIVLLTDGKAFSSAGLPEEFRGKSVSQIAAIAQKRGITVLALAMGDAKKSIPKLFPNSHRFVNDDGSDVVDMIVDLFREIQLRRKHGEDYAQNLSPPDLDRHYAALGRGRELVSASGERPGQGNVSQSPVGANHDSPSPKPATGVDFTPKAMLMESGHLMATPPMRMGHVDLVQGGNVLLQPAPAQVADESEPPCGDLFRKMPQLRQRIVSAQEMLSNAKPFPYRETLIAKFNEILTSITRNEMNRLIIAIQDHDISPEGVIKSVAHLYFEGKDALQGWQSVAPARRGMPPGMAPANTAPLFGPKSVPAAAPPAIFH